MFINSCIALFINSVYLEFINNTKFGDVIRAKYVYPTNELTVTELG